MRRSILAAFVLSALSCGRTIEQPAPIATTVEVVSGNNQTAIAGLPLPSQPEILVKDQYGQPLGGVALTITVTVGGGSIASAATITSVSGRATVGTWTLGATPGTNVLTVLAGGRVTRSVVATGTAGPAATILLKSTVLNLSATVGLFITTNIVFQVVDQANNPIQGVTVTGTATNGGSAVFNSPLTDFSGNVTLTRWTLGTVAGPQTMSVTVAGLTPITLSATALPAAPVALVATNTTALTGFASGAASAAPAVRVVDPFGNVVPGVSVGFSVFSGGGTLATPTTSVSNASGIATAGTWTLGRTLALQSVRAAITGASTIVAGQVQSSFRASVRYAGTVNTDVQARTQGALDRLRMTVVGQFGDFAVAALDLFPACGVTGLGLIDETIQDIAFYVQEGAIDGVGGTKVQSTQCVNRATGQGVITAIRVDVADYPAMIADGSLEPAILHEMLHGLGFGRVWLIALLQDAGAINPRFLGPLATAAFAAAGGVSSPGVPAENVGAVGVRDVHWRSTSFGDELMTSVVLAGQLRPMSRITIQSLADIGFTVNLGMADSFTANGALRAKP